MTLGARLGIATATLSIVGSIVGSTLWLAKKFSDQDTRIAKVESAVKVLNSTQDPKYQQLIKDLMARENLPVSPTVHRLVRRLWATLRQRSTGRTIADIGCQMTFRESFGIRFCKILATAVLVLIALGMVVMPGLKLLNLDDQDALRCLRAGRTLRNFSRLRGSWCRRPHDGAKPRVADCRLHMGAMSWAFDGSVDSNTGREDVYPTVYSIGI